MSVLPGHVLVFVNLILSKSTSSVASETRILGFDREATNPRCRPPRRLAYRDHNSPALAWGKQMFSSACASNRSG
jgi:hypothetical protein